MPPHENPISDPGAGKSNMAWNPFPWIYPHQIHKKPHFSIKSGFFSCGNELHKQSLKVAKHKLQWNLRTQPKDLPKSDQRRERRGDMFVASTPYVSVTKLQLQVCKFTTNTYGVPLVRSRLGPRVGPYEFTSKQQHKFEVAMPVCYEPGRGNYCGARLWWSKLLKLNSMHNIFSDFTWIGFGLTIRLNILLII